MWGELSQFVVTAGATAIALRFAGFRFWREKQKPPKTVCGCEHEFAMHDLRTGECHGTVREPTKFNGAGSVIAWKPVRCTCRHYTGPMPVELEFRPPPIMPRDEASG